MKTVTVSRVPSGKFFVSVLVEDENQVPDVIAQTWARAVGGDLGLHDFLVLSTGEKYGHPQWLESELSRLKILQRRLAKTAKGSKNRTKIRRKIARWHEQVANRRQDFLHKLSTDLVRRFDTVCIEDLNVAGMARNHALARRIAQSGWGEFRRQLEYKAQWYGKHVRVIGRFAPSSRRTILNASPLRSTRQGGTRPVSLGSALPWTNGDSPKKRWRKEAGTRCREDRESPGFSRGEDVNLMNVRKKTSREPKKPPKGSSNVSNQLEWWE